MLETRSFHVLSYAVLLVLAASASLTLGQVDSVCNNASLNLCDLCIRAAPECSWCPILEEGIDAIMEQLRTEGYVNYRCRGPAFPLNCTESVAPLDGSEENRQSEVINVEDRELSKFANETIITQVQPQNVSIKLRQGDTAKFNMTFVSLRNTPLDVYFLTDVSASLQFSINVLRQGITNIARSLEEISTGFAIGFGSFVDKKILPFGQDSNLVYNESTNEPFCRVFNRDECEPSYVYRHSISLTNNVSYFQDILPNVSLLSRSLDSPESPLDALVQAALCTNVIGWRDDALKMAFVITDQSYKIAGDGRLAGIFTPNQGKCNLAKIPGTNEYEYTRGTEEDYVSVWQVRDALERSRIVPIFVIQFDLRCYLSNGMLECPNPRLQREPYEDLLQEFDLRNIRGQYRFFNSSPGQNSSDVTEELINIIQGAYSATVQQVAVNTPTNIDGYSISIAPVEGCNRNDSESACQVNFGDTVTFEVSVTLQDCSTARRFRHQLRGGPYDFTYIDVEPLCECECTANKVTDDSVCTNGRGNLTCGVCECEPGFSGPECQCTDRGTCLSSSDCNGYVCDICGFCDCNGTAFGENCQCNDTNNPCPVGDVPMREGVEDTCSGPERGQCNCELGRCECAIAPLSGVSYFGEDGTAANANANDNNCECDPDQCYNPQFPGGLCYDQVNREYVLSRCGCSGCVCGANQFMYRSTCVNSDLMCMELATCVQCHLENPCSEPPCPLMNCPGSGYACQNRTFKQLGGDDDITDGFQDRCELEFEGCTVEFYFSTRIGDPIEIENSSDYSCPASTIPWIIAGSLVGAILLLGLLALIIIKICLVFLERVEYRKFTQELQEADFAPHENPLYITPQQDYQNPIRRSSTRRSQ